MGTPKAKGIGSKVKQSEIKVGDTVYTYIGERLCAVVVTREVVQTKFGRSRAKTYYQVARVENPTMPLPKLRSARCTPKREPKNHGYVVNQLACVSTSTSL